MISKRCYFFTLLISIILFTYPGFGQTWQTLADASGNATYRHDDVYFVSTAVGYTVYYNSSSGTQLGTIFKTTNGGTSWTAIKTSSGTHFRCITFMDSQVGIAGNLGKGSYDNAYDTIPVYRTTDGGQTWMGTNPYPAGLKGLCALFKVDNNTIYGVGRVQGPAYLLKSTNKGASWNVSNLSVAGLGAAMDLYFFNADTGFVVGMDSTPYQTGNSALYKGKVIYTTNGGQTWTTVLREKNVNPSYFWKISFPTRKTGYTSLQQNTSAYTTVVYYKTIDGGANWTRYEIPTSLFGTPVNLYTQGIGFIDENYGWIGGGGFATNFLETKDGGVSWSNITSTYSARINKFRVFGDTVYASGIRIHRLALPHVLTLQNDANEDDHVSVFPIPFRNNLTVRLREETWTTANLTIHTVSGEEIYHQYIGLESTISLEHLVSGIYFLKVQSGEKIWFRRIVKE